MKLLLNPVAWAVFTFAIALAFDVIAGAVAGIYAIVGLEAFSMVAPYIAACWVWKDSRMRRIYFSSDIALFWFWIGFPAYLYESRGVKGVFVFIGLVAASLGVALVLF